MRRLVPFVALVLAACGSTPPRAPEAPSAPAGAVPAPPPRATGQPLSPKYYKDDGPGDVTPGNLDQIPDAVPTLEPLHRYANRPYTVLGRDYVPATALKPYRERGVASWYGRKFHGEKTSTGETYDMFGMSAAHPTLPLPSYAKVTSLATGRSVIVRVNDRGPFLQNRVIDLSYAAAHRIGIAQKGSGDVEVEAILPGASTTLVAAAPMGVGANASGATGKAASAATGAAASGAATSTGAPAGTGTNGVVVAALPPAPAPTAVALAAAPPAGAAASMPSAASSAGSPTPLTVTSMNPEPPVPVAPVLGGFAVQLGAFSTYANAQNFLAHVQNQLATVEVEGKVRQSGGMFRVYVGPYPQRDDARRVGDRLGTAFGIATTITPH